MAPPRHGRPPVPVRGSDLAPQPGSPSAVGLASAGPTAERVPKPCLQDSTERQGAIHLHSIREQVAAVLSLVLEQKLGP